RGTTEGTAARATVTTRPTGETPPDGLYRLSLDRYHRMAELDILTPRDRVVLLDGLLVKKMTKGSPHATATRKLVKALEVVVPPGWLAIKEDPISIPGGPEGTDSEPEPDVAVVRGSIDDYADHHPGPGDVALVV